MWSLDSVTNIIKSNPGESKPLYKKNRPGISPRAANHGVPQALRHLLNKGVDFTALRWTFATEP